MTSQRIITCLEGVKACYEKGIYTVYDNHGLVQVIALGVDFDPILMTTTFDPEFEYFFIDYFPMPAVGDRTCKSFFFAKKARCVPTQPSETLRIAPKTWKEAERLSRLALDGIYFEDKYEYERHFEKTAKSIEDAMTAHTEAALNAKMEK